MTQKSSFFPSGVPEIGLEKMKICEKKKGMAADATNFIVPQYRVVNVKGHNVSSSFKNSVKKFI
jgi:hypothetical protein